MGLGIPVAEQFKIKSSVSTKVLFWGWAVNFNARIATWTVKIRIIANGNYKIIIMSCSVLYQGSILALYISTTNERTIIMGFLNLTIFGSLLVLFIQLAGYV